VSAGTSTKITKGLGRDRAAYVHFAAIPIAKASVTVRRFAGDSWGGDY